MAEPMMEVDSQHQIPRVILSTKTALSDRFKQMAPSTTAKKAPEFDLEHDEGHGLELEGLPPHRKRSIVEVRNAAANPVTQAQSQNQLFALQLASKQRQDMLTKQIIAQARHAAQMEIAAALGSSGYTGGLQDDFGFGYPYPSVPFQPRGNPGYPRGMPGYGESLGNHMAGNYPAAAMALARNQARAYLPALVRGRVGAPRGNFNQGLTGIRKGSGSIIKTNTGLPGRRSTPFANVSKRFDKPKPVITAPTVHNRIRKRGNGQSVGGALSGTGFNKKEVVLSKDELDDDLDDYMSKRKSSTKALDKDLEIYMKAAKKAAAMSSAEEAKILAAGPDEEELDTLQTLCIKEPAVAVETGDDDDTVTPPLGDDDDDAVTATSEENDVESMDE